MDISYEDVLNILRIIDQSSCEELHLEIGEFKLVVRKKGAGTSAHTADSPAPTDAKALGPEWSENEVQVVLPSQGAPAGAGRQAGDLAMAQGTGVVVKAPMIGVFYQAPAPGAAPFVEVGSVVAEDDTVCIIEVMKLMNSIKAGCRGRVVQILAENGALVEYGQPLMVIESRP